jgi:hypothetical protein
VELILSNGDGSTEYWISTWKKKGLKEERKEFDPYLMPYIKIRPRS